MHKLHNYIYVLYTIILSVLLLVFNCCRNLTIQAMLLSCCPSVKNYDHSIVVLEVCEKLHPKVISKVLSDVK